jgi:hypothetical protein
MCDEEAIDLEDGSINQDTYKSGEEFHVNLKVKFHFNFFLKLKNFIYKDQSTC